MVDLYVTLEPPLLTGVSKRHVNKNLYLNPRTVPEHLHISLASVDAVRIGWIVELQLIISHVLREGRLLFVYS